MRILKRLLRPRRNMGEGGQSLAEFALVFPIMLLVLCSIVELGRAVMTMNVVTGAAREGARVGAISSSGFTQAKQAAMTVLDAAGLSDYTVTVAGPDGNGNVQCTVNASHTVLTGALVPGFSGEVAISHTSHMRWEG